MWSGGGPTYGNKDIANLSGVALDENSGIISASGGNNGTVTIGGYKSTVICSYINPYTKKAGKNQFEAGIHADNAVVIKGGSEGSIGVTFKCINARTGIKGYNSITLDEYSNIQIENVEDGIRCDSSSSMVNINSNSTVYVSADRDAISAMYGVKVEGNVKVSLKSNGSGNGAGIWVSSPKAGSDAVVINLESGYFSAYAPNANFGICVNENINSNIVINISQKKGVVTCEGTRGGIEAAGGNISMNVAGKVIF